ncbi:YchJ family metal-binding protein [uncultured Limnobacter sp.]|jgi:SEC-C motif-containing protein|uniref:YchJ family protein n=1 Tax=Limnobacter sp. TaxID=2003368 RepID=UPI0030F87C9A
MKNLHSSPALPYMVQKNKSLLCPCGKGSYASCCEPFHINVALPPTAEALMRSRYSAYAMGLSDYVLSTWHASTRPNQLDLQQELAQGQWLGLNVKGHWPQGKHAEVEFVARYKPHSGPASRLHERSRFVQENGQWFYVDGDLFSS